MEVMRFLKTSRADLRPWINKWAECVHSVNVLDNAVIHMPGMIRKISCPTEKVYYLQPACYFWNFTPDT